MKHLSTYDPLESALPGHVGGVRQILELDADAPRMDYKEKAYRVFSTEERVTVVAGPFRMHNNWYVLVRREGKQGLLTAIASHLVPVESEARGLIRSIRTFLTEMERGL